MFHALAQDWHTIGPFWGGIGAALFLPNAPQAEWANHRARLVVRLLFAALCWGVGIGSSLVSWLAFLALVPLTVGRSFLLARLRKRRGPAA